MLLFSSFHKPHLISQRKSDGVIDNTKPLAELYSWFWRINSALSIICQKSVAHCQRIRGKFEFCENKRASEGWMLLNIFEALLKQIDKGRIRCFPFVFLYIASRCYERYPRSSNLFAINFIVFIERTNDSNFFTTS